MNPSQQKKFETKESNYFYEFERESESSENSSSNYKGYSSELSSTYDNGEGSVTSLECHMDQLCFEDEFCFEGSDDEVIPIEEIELKEILKELLPALSEYEIELLIDEFKESNDVDSVVDFYLQQEESMRSYASSSTSFMVKDDDTSLSVSESRPKKPRKRKKKKKQDYHPPDFERPTSDSSRLEVPPFSSAWNAHWPPLPEPKKPPSWDAQWPPLPSTSPGNKINKSPNLSRGDIDDNQYALICQLSEIFPQHDSQSLLTVLEAANGDLDYAAYLLVANYPPSRDEAGPSIETRVHKINKRVIPARSLDMHSSYRASTAKFTPNENSLDDEDDEASSSYEPKYCRNMIERYEKMRNESFRKADEARRSSRSSRNGEGGISFYYSTQGHEYDKEMKKWRLRAAKSIVQQRSRAAGNDHLLDLHKLTVEQARAVVKEELNKWYSRGMMNAGRKPPRPLKIVTGVGNHSRDGPKLPNAISRFLEENNWVFSKHDGYVMVKGHQSIN